MSNIETRTLQNEDYRRVIQTTPQTQLVIMSLKPGEDIPSEIHTHGTQFIRIESGVGVAVIDRKVTNLKTNDFIIIPPGKRHYILNTSVTKSLKLYTLYSPPEHPKNKVNKRQPDQK